MVENIKCLDELYYLDRTRGIYCCTIHHIVETNGIISYIDNNNIAHNQQDLYCSKSAMIDIIPTRIKYNNIPDLPSGTKEFKYGDKVYFIGINPYMIHDAILTTVEKRQSYAYDGYTFSYHGKKEGYFAEHIYKPFATLSEVKEYITRT